MAKSITILTIVCLCLMFVMENIAYGINTTFTQIEIQEMKKHIDKMKIKNPQKYQSMIERAGGNFTHCCSCHVELCAGNIPTQQLPTPQPPTPQIKTPKPPKKF